jgi:superoxide dismutase
MQLHHDKHHQAYVDKVNAALEEGARHCRSHARTSSNTARNTWAAVSGHLDAITAAAARHSRRGIRPVRVIT